MLRLAFAAGIFVVTVFAGVLVVRAGPEHDVNQDGLVDLTDALDVLAHFGEEPPTPTPSPLVVGDRAIVNVNRGHALVDTANNTILASYLQPDDSAENSVFISCDGRLIGIGNRSTLTTPPQANAYLRIADGVTGQMLLDEAMFYSNLFTPPGMAFPCPLKNLGAQVSSGSPVTNRVVIWYHHASGYFGLEIRDIQTGVVIHSDLVQTWRFSCDQRQALLSRGSDAVIVDLLDGVKLHSISSIGVLCRQLLGERRHK